MKWISVKDRLPENYTFVVAWSYRLWIGWHYCLYENGQFTCEDDNLEFELENVTHWMIPTIPKSKLKKFTMDKWTESLPDNAQLTTKEVSKIFGYARESSVCQAYQQGIIPAPDVRKKRRSSGCVRLGWTVGYLRGLASKEL